MTFQLVKVTTLTVIADRCLYLYTYILEPDSSCDYFFIHNGHVIEHDLSKLLISSSLG